MVLDALAPVDPLERLLAQAADGYSEWNYPRRWVFGLAVAVILLAAGFTGARTHADVRAGTLTALAASVIGGVLAVLVAVIGRAVLGPLGFFFDIEGLLPLSMAGTVLGTVGAMIGRGVRPHRAAAMPTRSV